MSKSEETKKTEICYTMEPRCFIKITAIWGLCRYRKVCSTCNSNKKTAKNSGSKMELWKNEVCMTKNEIIS